jgi:SIR2-like protein
MPDERGAFTFAEVRPRLVSAYEAGRLVPFIGVGMSRPNCAGWPGLIGGLEREAGVSSMGLDPPTDKTPAPELIQRANRAVRRLRASEERAFADALRRALFTTTEPAPRQTLELASIWWPLVLTTNYDNLYVEAFARTFGGTGLAVVGRGSEDCQRVLTSLSTAGRALLWALQGHIAAPAVVEGHDHDRRLARELVLDHDEYRRVTHREPHFRRAFAEVFRHRSLLFLGSGLRETYLQELFGEVLELYGPSTRTHYAIMPYGEVDPRFMFARFQIAIVEYPPAEERTTPDVAKPGADKPNPHRFLPEWLGHLRGSIEASERVPVSWTWGRVRHGNRARAPSIDLEVDTSAIDLEIVRGPLPDKHLDGECLVVSAGGQLDKEEFWLSTAMTRVVSAWCRNEVSFTSGPSDSHRPDEKFSKRSDSLGEWVGYHAFAVRARRQDDDAKDLLKIRPASRELFETVGRRYRGIRMQLLASGGGHYKAGEPRWSARTFPARYALVEIVRAWREWREANPGADCRLALHVVDPSVTREISSGRIDVVELLQAADIRFWAEIVENGVLLERRLFHKDEATQLQSIVDELDLPVPHWKFLVSPPTGIWEATEPTALEAVEAGRPQTSRSLRELGVVPGSVLHFRRDTGRAPITR